LGALLEILYYYLKIDGKFVQNFYGFVYITYQMETPNIDTPIVTEPVEVALVEVALVVNAGPKDGLAIMPSGGADSAAETKVSCGTTVADEKEKKGKNSAAAATVATETKPSSKKEKRAKLLADALSNPATDALSKPATDALSKPATKIGPASTVLVKPSSSGSLSKTTPPKATAGGGVAPPVHESLDDLLSRVESLTNSVLSKKGHSTTYAEAATPHVNQTVEDLTSQLKEVVCSDACEKVRKDNEDMVRMQNQLAKHLFDTTWEPTRKIITSSIANVKAAIIATTDQAPTDDVMKMTLVKPEHPSAVQLVAAKAKFDDTLSKLNVDLKDLEERLRLHLLAMPLTHAQAKVKKENDKIQKVKQAAIAARTLFDSLRKLFFDGKASNHLGFATVCESLAEKGKLSFDTCIKSKVDPHTFAFILMRENKESTAMTPAFVVCNEKREVRPLSAISPERIRDICFKFWTKFVVILAPRLGEKGMQPQHLIANAVHFEKGLTPADRKEKLEQRKIQLESYKSSAGAPAVARTPASAPSSLPSNQFAALDSQSDITLPEILVIEPIKPVLKTRGGSAQVGCRSATSAGERASTTQSTKVGSELVHLLSQVNTYAHGIPANRADFLNPKAWSSCATNRAKIMNKLSELGFPVETMEEVFCALVELGCIESMDSVIQTKKGKAKSVRKVLCTSAKQTASHASSCGKSQGSQEAFPALSRSSNRSAAPAPAPADATTVVVVPAAGGGGGSAPAPAPDAAVDIDQQIAKYKHSMRNMMGCMVLDEIRGDEMPSGAVKALDAIHAHCKALNPPESLIPFLEARKVIEVIEVNHSASTFRVISN
jgi:hypothetical protein